ncbi:hypothetical protein CHLRE_17g698650v5 [Chlamydomonas reinhardtii]|uniref:Glutathione hydrolase n=1 Tax=Chlamydomonas reinhardtii TaxID=3055 RepID=A0A2K3CNS7_CHLRE|nr:uncharacterized protein CHLRE_17g698650v5 [Chlamydomonas reinhardtii]PNW69930.1 hypothetical protein CHLRE_17g698650v5 [Chlamydomonas reinhardtii]
MDVEASAEQPLLRGDEARKRPNSLRCGVVAWAVFAAVLVFLIVMTATFAGRGGGSSGSSSSGKPTFAVPPGAIVGCTDSELLCLIARPVPGPDADYRGHPRKVRGSKGLVATDQSRCADIGAEVLQEGGHAVDAAVAAALCQGVVNPFASGAGGGFFALLRDGASGAAEFVNAREVAPAAAYADMYSGKPAGASLEGGLAVAVPMELKGLEAMWRRHGRLPWRRLVAPAAAIARHGFAAHPYYTYSASGPGNLKKLRASALAREAFLVLDAAAAANASALASGEAWRAPEVGELCCARPRLADTLEAVGRYGVSWLYSPARAEVLAAEVRAAGGIMTAADILAAEPRIQPPLSYTLPGPVPYTLLVPPPPSSGPVLYLALSVLLGYLNSSSNGAATANATAAATAAWAAAMGGLPELATHRTVEAMKHAFAVRMALGDPGPDPAAPPPPGSPYVDVREVMADIADPAFAAELRAAINDSSVLDLANYGGRWNPKRTGVSPDDHGTSHLSVLDGEGNAVSLTTTVNTGFGSGLVSRSTGLLLNNEMDDFSQPGAPNKYNLEPAVANYIAPGKQPLSSMAPALLLAPPPAAAATATAAAAAAATAGGGQQQQQQQQLRLVVGASNGPRIITGILQTVIRLLYGGSDLLAAVSDSRLHSQWLPDSVLFENYTLNGVDFSQPPGLVAALEARGDTLEPFYDQLGDVQAILLDEQQPPAGGGGGGGGVAATAVSDPRKDGAPAAAG